VPLDGNFNQFASALVDALSDRVQIAFSSRLFTQNPWHDMIKDGKAVVLGTEYRQNSDLMFTVEEEPRPQVEIYALGRGHAVVNGQEISNWDGALPRNLFFYFVDNPMVTRDDIFGTFWPNLPIKEATNVFHVTKRKISERISSKVDTEGNYELTQYTSGFYIPSDKVVRHYDAGDFQEAVELATATFDEREEEELFRRAVDLYKAPFLETLDMDWVIERREQLKLLHSQALIGLARIHKNRGENEEAVGLFVRALKETPEREDIYREVISLYAGMGMMDDANEQYDHLKAYLKSKRLKPDDATKALMASLNGK
jgi:two-component SAPR family response regulator